jgi:hypothetical protein
MAADKRGVAASWEGQHWLSEETVTSLEHSDRLTDPGAFLAGGIWDTTATSPAPALAVVRAQAPYGW